MQNTTSDIVLLDGGMGQELVRRSGEAPTPLWSAHVMMKKPAIVRDLHVDFIKAGARVITLNTYSATPDRLQRDGAADQFQKLTGVAVSVAREAREKAGVEEVKIAGCLPPLVTSYRPDLTPEFNDALDTYRRIVAAQAEHVDVLLCETMSSVREARAAAIASKESGKPVWVALSVEDDESDTTTARLRSGEPLADALTALDEIGVEAKLLNCSKPEAITSCWTVFSKNQGPLGAYANGFTSISDLTPGGTVDSLEARHDLGPEAYAEFALGWVTAGAAIVGGCCEVGPAHIKKLAERLQAEGFVLVSSV